jgi:hypothetical protein
MPVGRIEATLVPLFGLRDEAVHLGAIYVRRRVACAMRTAAIPVVSVVIRLERAVWRPDR